MPRGLKFHGAHELSLFRRIRAPKHQQTNQPRGNRNSFVLFQTIVREFLQVHSKDTFETARINSSYILPLTLLPIIVFILAVSQKL